MGGHMQKFALAGILTVLCLCRLAPVVQGQQVTDATEVSALLAVRDKLEDPKKNLNWTRKFDPCATNWTGVKCLFNGTDGYLHVDELRLMQLNLFGTLAPELGQLSRMTILNFMGNNISGEIPKEIGNITTLVLLLLSRNQITGQLHEELGFLPHLTRFQVDHNMISGSIPTTLENLVSVEHLHMNNNQFSGPIPPQISNLTTLEHILLDKNNLSGHLPPELALTPNLTILQLDHNNFAGSGIPDSYTNVASLVKLSLRNCNLKGPIPDVSSLGKLSYLDLSKNNLTGNIMTNRLSENITTIILSHNMLNGTIPSNFSGLPRLQKLSLSNNRLSGYVPSNIWENIPFATDSKLDIDLEHNLLSDINGTLDNIPPNVTLRLSGNSVCTNGNQQNISLLCGGVSGNDDMPDDDLKQPTAESKCSPRVCQVLNYYVYVQSLPDKCFCAVPFRVDMQLRSPSIYQFPPYQEDFKEWILKSFAFMQPLLQVDSIEWESGPRLTLKLLFFPKYNKSQVFDFSEVQAIATVFAHYRLDDTDVFGPYDVIKFVAEGPYANMLLPSVNHGGGGLSKGAVAGIVLGSISFIVVCSLVCWLRKRRQGLPTKFVRDQRVPRVEMKADGLKAFDFEDLEIATNNFTTQIGQGGYGKVYKGTIADGAVVAIKRAHQGSLQGGKEFYTEIEMLSRLHHRNLVSLVGYCNENDEQMLVYEFMPNGSLQDLLSAKYTTPVNLVTRLHIALGASKGILYLHKEADPAIIHRDIKANNILLDSKWNAKVADFGISRLAPISDDAKGGVTPTYVSTNVKGTPGYLDPEYFLTHKLTEKSDVYSLGIVFLELLTGMQPITRGQNIVREVKSACDSGMMDSIIDRTMGPYPTNTVKRFMGLALKCSMEETKDRPYVPEIVRELENISSSLLLESNDNFNPTSEPRPYTSMDLYPVGDLLSGAISTITPR